jgi:hypothetical protein
MVIQTKESGDGKKSAVCGPTIIVPDNPFATARLFHEEHYGGTLVRHQGSWWRWERNKYLEISEEDVRANAWRWLASCERKQGKKLVRYVPSRGFVSATLDGLRAAANLPGKRQMPCWIGEGEYPQPENIVAFANGLLDLGTGSFQPHSPRWFSTTCLERDFDGKAKCPH